MPALFVLLAAFGGMTSMTADDACVGPGDNGRVKVASAAGLVRGRLGAAIFERVAGPEGPARRRVIHDAAGERWFAADRPVRRVHGDSAMFIGGIRALLLQSLHPLAMAAVAGHSGYRGDPWGRLQRTSYFLAITTFGRTSDSLEAIARVRAIHERVTGTAPDGLPYAASDPHLLTWVHITEADSFLRAHIRFGAEPLDKAGRDGYVADMARIGAALGVPDPPRTEAELATRITAYRAELAGTAQAREAARFLLLTPPLPAIARPPYTVLAAAAVSLLPGWARPAAAPAPPASDRGRGRPPRRPCPGSRHPLGHHRAPANPGQLAQPGPGKRTLSAACAGMTSTGQQRIFMQVDAPIAVLMPRCAASCWTRSWPPRYAR